MYLVLAFSVFYGSSKLLDFTVDTTQREPQIDRNRGLYEVAEGGCVVVVFLFLVPFSLLLNENFDLHERSWVNFNNWRDTHTIGDKYAESRNSQRRYFKQEDAPQLSSFEPFETWLRSHSSYFYFPYTFMAESYKENLGDTKEKHASNDCYQLPNEYEDYDVKGSIEDIRIMDVIDFNTPHNHNHYTNISVRSKKEDKTKYFVAQLSAPHDVTNAVDQDHFLSELLYIIPRFSEIGSALLQSPGKHHVWLKEWTACEHNSDFLCTVFALPHIDAAFAITQYFPHTRTSDHKGFITYLAVLILLSILVLVLMRISLPVLIPNLTFQCPNELRKHEDEYWYSRNKYLSQQKDIVMANLAYFGLANPRNTLALDSLLGEEKIIERRMGYEIVDPAEIRNAKSRMTKAEMITLAKIEGQGAWRHARAPLALLILGAVLFAIYAAQDELSSILQIFGSIAALLVTAKSVLGNIKNPGE
ncbi:MAG: hypothetical protein IPG06_20935 [Haliea sp.]|nr:hypothetical protein [Haliea sp.]